MAPPPDPASPTGGLLRRRTDGGRDWYWVGRTNYVEPAFTGVIKERTPLTFVLCENGNVWQVE